MSFINDFDSANNSWNSIKKELDDLFGRSSDIRDIESMDSELCQMFDKTCGIDAIQFIDGQARGVAIRVQWGVSYETFTIRFKRRSGVKTEWGKRMEAITQDKGYLYPYLTIQIYLNNKSDNEILSICIVKTKDLYNYAAINIADLKRNKCPEGNEFLIVPFSAFSEKSCIRLDPIQNKKLAS